MESGGGFSDRDVSTGFDRGVDPEAGTPSLADFEAELDRQAQARAALQADREQERVGRFDPGISNITVRDPSLGQRSLWDRLTNWAKNTAITTGTSLIGMPGQIVGPVVAIGGMLYDKVTGQPVSPQQFNQRFGDMALSMVPGFRQAELVGRGLQKGLGKMGIGPSDGPTFGDRPGRQEGIERAQADTQTPFDRNAGLNKNILDRRPEEIAQLLRQADAARRTM